MTFNTISRELVTKGRIEEINCGVALGVDGGHDVDAVVLPISRYPVIDGISYELVGTRTAYTVQSRLKKGQAWTHEKCDIATLVNLQSRQSIELPEATIRDAELAVPVLGLCLSPRCLLLPRDNPLGEKVRKLFDECQRKEWTTVDQLQGLLSSEINAWKGYYTVTVLQATLDGLGVPANADAADVPLTIALFLHRLGTHVHTITKIPLNADRKRRARTDHDYVA